MFSLSISCLGLSQQSTLSIINTHKLHRMFRCAHTSSHWGDYTTTGSAWAACPGSWLEMQGPGPRPAPAGLASMGVTVAFRGERRWAKVPMQLRILVLFPLCPASVVLGWQYLCGCQCLLRCLAGTRCPPPFPHCQAKRNTNHPVTPGVSHMHISKENDDTTKHRNEALRNLLRDWDVSLSCSVAPRADHPEGHEGWVAWPECYTHETKYRGSWKVVELQTQSLKPALAIAYKK